MTFKPFKIDDLGAFLPNEYSNPDEIFPMMVRGMEVNTMWGDYGDVKAFLCARPYWGRCWACFILVGVTFTMEDSLVLRERILEEMLVKRALRLETVSQKDDKLRKWHEFLGFTLEGTKRKMMFDKDYDVWGIVKECL